MLRVLCTRLAKAGVAPVRRKVLKRLPRRAYSVGGSGKAGRKTKAVRKGSLSGAAAASGGELRRSKDVRRHSVAGGTRIDEAAASTNSASSAITTATGAIATAAAAAGEQALAPSSELTPRRLNYRLATAVATVVVPPTANKVLEGMKQIITPASRRPTREDGGGGGGGGQQVMEEYYTSRKGPLFATAVIAGTNAVKQASALIPFCHPVPVQKCSFTFRRRVVGDGLRPTALPHRVVLRKRAAPPLPLPSKPECSVLYCFCTVATEEYKTGVEMEALTGATMAAITLYDMLKTLPGAQEDGLQLSEAFVLAKRGGKNDFIKLLMSESVRGAGPQALPESATLPDKAQVTASVAATTEGGKAAPAVAAGDAAAARRDDKDGNADDEEGRVSAGTLGPRVVRRLPQLEVAAAANHSGRRDGVPGTSSPLLPGDTGAWWRSSKHERRLQELYPRRKYGEGARVAEPGVAPAGAAAAAKLHEDGTAAAAAAAANDDAGDDDSDEAVGEAKGARSRNAGQRQGGTQPKSSAAAHVEECDAGHDDAAAEEDEEADDDDEEATAAAGAPPSRMAGRRPVTGRTGRPGRAAGEARPIATALTTARARVKGTATAAVTARQRASRAAAARIASDEAADADGEEEEEEAGAEEEEEHGDDEEQHEAAEDEKAAARGAGQAERRGGKGRDAKSAAVTRTRRTAKTAAAMEEDEDAVAEEEHEVAEEAEEEGHVVDDEEAEEEVVHVRKSSTPVARLRPRAGGSAHEASGAPLRRPKRGSLRAVEEVSKSQSAPRARRGGGEGRADSVVRRHGRDPRHESYALDEGEEEASSEDAEEEEGYDDEDEQEEDGVPMSRRAAPAPQHRGRAHGDEAVIAAASRRRVAGEMLPVQHDSWDNETTVASTEPTRLSAVSRKLKKKSVSRR